MKTVGRENEGFSNLDVSPFFFQPTLLTHLLTHTLHPSFTAAFPHCVLFICLYLPLNSRLRANQAYESTKPQHAQWAAAAAQHGNAEQYS